MLRRAVGMALMRLAVRVLGRAFVDEVRRQPDDFEDENDYDYAPFPAVTLNARAREMRAEGEALRQTEAPPERVPLKGSAEERILKVRSERR